MKVLNLYSGIGGNRKLWTDCEVTAVENNTEIASVYSDLFPHDKVVIANAHQYLLNHYEEFDFIWSSPPCPTHSNIRSCGVYAGQYKAKYPAMDLYQEIILLQHFAKKKTKFVVENVIPYYNYLIPPTHKMGRHAYWTNFRISNFKATTKRIHNTLDPNKDLYGFNIKDTNIKNKRQVLRNMVNPELGLHIFNCFLFSIKPTPVQGGLFDKS
jgi:DNA (cytosine-5)-methyltransferase 1|tara:strand:- start:2917 stop:3552 length:636 start_codon:yes stop_codon:yes gene_type:complete